MESARLEASAVARTQSGGQAGTEPTGLWGLETWGQENLTRDLLRDRVVPWTVTETPKFP